MEVITHKNKNCLKNKLFYLHYEPHLLKKMKSVYFSDNFSIRRKCVYFICIRCCVR